jgi:splicing factor 3B subunit 5
MSGATSSSSGGGLDGLTAEQLKARYVGTGHSDMTKHEFLVNQHRDTYASIVGHHDQLAYCAVARNESMGRLRLEFLERMVLPCGPPPPPKDVEKLLEEKE